MYYTLPEHDERHIVDHQLHRLYKEMIFIDFRRLVNEVLRSVSQFSS